MKPGFDIKEYRLGRRAGLYTVRLHSEPTSEIDRFLSNPQNRRSEDFNRLVHYLSRCPSRGFREMQRPEKARFRDEDDILALSVAHPDERIRFPQSLRLFCLRYQDVAILGSGAVKRPATLDKFRKEEPEADRAVRLMKEVRKRLDYRLGLHDIQVRDVCLVGDLSFPPDTY